MWLTARQQAQHGRYGPFPRGSGVGTSGGERDHGYLRRCSSTRRGWLPPAPTAHMPGRSRSTTHVMGVGPIRSIAVTPNGAIIPARGVRSPWGRPIPPVVARRVLPNRRPADPRPASGDRGVSMTGPEAPAIPDELTTVLRRLRLSYVRSSAPEVLATARSQRWDPAEVLRVLLVEEARGRDEATRALRRKRAGFLTGKTLDSWREADSSIPVATQRALGTLEWIGRAENLAITGPSGTGKTHFAQALAHRAIDSGLRVSWFTLESLTAKLARATVDGSVAKAVTRICRVELIAIDDIGILPAGQDSAQGLLPGDRRRLREDQRHRDLERSPLRIRQDHAHGARQRSGRPAHASRPRGRNRGILAPVSFEHQKTSHRQHLFKINHCLI